MLENTIARQGEVVITLEDLHASFNRVQVSAYLPLEKVILKAIAKAEDHDDAIVWSDKSAMFLQSQIALKQIPIAKGQNISINSLGGQRKSINLNYMHLIPINDGLRFD